jgi:zinc finger protein
MGNEAQESIETLEGQKCPMCGQDTLTLMETERDIPYFGKVFLFSMNCSNCKYFKADIESEKSNGPEKHTFEIEKEEDMKVRVVKSSTATIKLPHITTVTPGAASNGYVTNVEGILNRIKKEIEFIRDNDDDNESRKKAKNLVKKLNKVMWGEEKLKLILEDPEGNSAIISDRTLITPLKNKK